MSTLLPDPPIKVASFSRLKKYEKCPMELYLSAVQKEPGPPREENNPAERGNRVHQEAEDFVKGEVEELPRSLSKFEGYFIDLKGMFADGMVELEQEWGFTKDWEICDYWNKNKVHKRIKCDNVIHHDETAATITDYKTGQKDGNEVSHTQQGQFYAIGTFLRYPKLTHVTVDFLYTDKGQRTTKHYTRDKIMRLITTFNQRIERMTTARAFPPKPNKFTCRFCDYGPNKGTGTCPYGVEF